MTQHRVATVGDLRRALMPFAEDTEIVVSFATEYDGDDLHVTGGIVGLSLETPCDPDEDCFIRLTASDLEEADRG